MDHLLYHELHRLTNATNFSSPGQIVEYQEKLKSMFKGKRINFPISCNSKDFELTRATKNDAPEQLYNTYRRGWYNDNKEQIMLNRCNFEGQQVFYCSDDPGTAVFEIRPKLGDWVTTVKIIFSKGNLRFLRLGIFNDPVAAPSFKLDKDEMDIFKFLEDKFKETISSEQKHLYFPTASICNIFYPDHMYDGIIYPSIASGLKGHNFVLKKEVVDRYAILKDITALEVVEYADPFNFKLKCKWYVYDMQEGQLAWEVIEDCKTHDLNESFYHEK